MAFSFRKMLSNINYFKKPGDEDDYLDPTGRDTESYVEISDSRYICFDRAEPDSTSKQCATSLKLPESIKNYTSKQNSLSDSDVKTTIIKVEPLRSKKKKSKSLKLDVNRSIESSSDEVLENTPKHVLLESERVDLFSQHLKEFDFDRSFDIFDDSSLSEEEDLDIESLSDETDSDNSITSNDDQDIKMCRKVESEPQAPQKSVSPESFADVEIDKNEEERMSLLLNYQMKLEKLDCVLKKLLEEFKFHVEISKVFHCRSMVTTLPGTDVSNIPKMLGEVTYIDNLNRGISPTGSWNIILEKEDDVAKSKVRNQLLSMKNCINKFVDNYIESENLKKSKKGRSGNRKSPDLKKGRSKHMRINPKKKLKLFDYPDIRESMINLFEPTSDSNESRHNVYNNISDYDESDTPKCECRCHSSSSSQADSGLITKNDRSLSSQSISSSIGNFSMDTSTLTAYSESLDQIISYNSFQDTSLMSSLLQKPAIERITFYVQVHSIQLKNEQSDDDYETKNIISFYCPSCKVVKNEEDGLLKHILSQSHCEKIHFQYKTAYIKKCMSSGKEIMPSTVLNPMTMYRDDNKIVCFGDAMYGCSLCFENLIVGESVLMAHCADPEHIERRGKLHEILG